MEAIDEKLITSFLLGGLSEDDRQSVEEHFFRDDSFYEQVLAFQEELADDYVQDRLSPGQRSQFEKYFLQSPRRRERVEFATAFSGALARPVAGDAAIMPVRAVLTTPAKAGWWEPFLAFLRPGLVPAMSLAMLLLLIGGTWLYLYNWRLSGDVAQAQKAREASIQQSQAHEAEAARKRQELESQIAALRTQGDELQSKVREKERELEALQRQKQTAQAESSAAFVATFTLLPGLTREPTEPERLIIPATARSVQLRLGLERAEDYQSYLAEVRTARGNLVWSKSGLLSQRSAAGQVVVLNFPNKYLANGEYEVTLKGAAAGKLDALGYYYFIALHK